MPLNSQMVESEDEIEDGTIMSDFLAAFADDDDCEDDYGGGDAECDDDDEDGGIRQLRTGAQSAINGLLRTDFMNAVDNGIKELMGLTPPVSAVDDIWTSQQESDALSYLSKNVVGWKCLMIDNMDDPIIATSIIQRMFTNPLTDEVCSEEVRRRVHGVYNIAKSGLLCGSPQSRDEFQEHGDTMGIVCVAMENAIQIHQQHNSIRQARFKTYSTLMDSIQQLASGGMDEEKGGHKIKLKPHQILYARLLKEAYQKQYKKQDDTLFKPVYINGRYIYAYVRAMTIREFVNGMPVRHPDAQTFVMMTDRQSTYTQLVRDLTHLESAYLPVLKTNRYVMAFENGLFWLDAPAANDEDGVTRLPPKRFFPFSQGVIPECMSVDSVAVSFHRMEYDYVGIEREMREWILRNPEEDIIHAYRGISMHPFNSVLEYQGYDEAEMCFVFGMLGRLMFKHNYRNDNFESELWFNGKAGTGKSTFMKWIQCLYTNKKDVGVISNNAERTYPLAGIADCLVYLVFEMNKNFTLDQMTYQSMVSGESVTIAAKYKTAQEVQWSAHGACACNQLPNWRNNFGSLKRRISVVEFGKKVREIKDDLFKNGILRLDRFLSFITAAYVDDLLYSVVGEGGRPFQSVIPKKIKNNTATAMTGCNPLLNYLDNEWEIVDEKESVEPIIFTQFQQKMSQYFITNNISERPSRNTLISRLDDEGIRTIKQNGISYLCNLRPVQ
jgi:hypothetical protein